MMKKILLLLTIVLAAVVVAAVLGVRNWPSDGIDAETVLAEAEAQEDGVIAQLTQGKALYEVDIVYRRHGPAADLIRQMATEWYLPERFVEETWFEVGPGGMVTQVRGWTKDENGTLLQDIYTVGGEVVTKDVASGQENRTPLRVSVEDIKATIQWGRQNRDEAILRGDAFVSSRNAQVIVIDQELPPLPASRPSFGTDSPGYSYTIPYVEDIRGVRRLSRTEVDAKMSRTLRWSTILIDASGKEWVVEERQRTVSEVVDASQVPSDR